MKMQQQPPQQSQSAQQSQQQPNSGASSGQSMPLSSMVQPQSQSIHPSSHNVPNSCGPSIVPSGARALELLDILRREVEHVCHDCTSFAIQREELEKRVQQSLQDINSLYQHVSDLEKQHTIMKSEMEAELRTARLEVSRYQSDFNRLGQPSCLFGNMSQKNGRSNNRDGNGANNYTSVPNSAAGVHFRSNINPNNSQSISQQSNSAYRQNINSQSYSHPIQTSNEQIKPSLQLNSESMPGVIPSQNYSPSTPQNISEFSFRSEKPLISQNAYEQHSAYAKRKRTSYNQSVPSAQNSNYFNSSGPVIPPLSAQGSSLHMDYASRNIPNNNQSSNSQNINNSTGRIGSPGYQPSPRIYQRSISQSERNVDPLLMSPKSLPSINRDNLIHGDNYDQIRAANRSEEGTGNYNDHPLPGSVVIPSNSNGQEQPHHFGQNQISSHNQKQSSQAQPQTASKHVNYQSSNISGNKASQSQQPSSHSNVQQKPPANNASTTNDPQIKSEFSQSASQKRNINPPQSLPSIKQQGPHNNNYIERNNYQSSKSVSQSVPDSTVQKSYAQTNASTLVPVNTDATFVSPHRKEGSCFVVNYNTSLSPASDISLVHTLKHSSVVCCVKFSPSGEYVATGCDRTAIIWDVKTGNRVSNLRDDSKYSKKNELYVRSVTFSPDSNLVACGAEDRVIRICDVKQGTVVQCFTGHDAHIYSLDFSPDGLYLVSGSGDRTARIWSLKKGICVHILRQELGREPHESGVTSVSFSPCSKYVATGSLDRVVRVYSVVTGEVIDYIQGHSDSVYSVAFRPDGKQLASASLDKNIRLWHIPDYATVISNSDRSNSDLESSSKNVNVVSVDGKQIRLNTYGTCEKVLNGHSDFVLSICYSPDGKYLLSGSKDRDMRMWDIATGNSVLSLTGHKNSVISVAFSQTGNYMATGSGDHRARVWKFHDLDPSRYSVLNTLPSSTNNGTQNSSSSNINSLVQSNGLKSVTPTRGSSDSSVQGYVESGSNSSSSREQIDLEDKKYKAAGLPTDKLYESEENDEKQSQTNIELDLSNNCPRSSPSGNNRHGANALSMDGEPNCVIEIENGGSRVSHLLVDSKQGPSSPRSAEDLKAESESNKSAGVTIPSSPPALG